MVLHRDAIALHVGEVERVQGERQGGTHFGLVLQSQLAIEGLEGAKVLELSEQGVELFQGLLCLGEE